MVIDTYTEEFKDRRRRLMLAGVLQCGDGLVWMLPIPAMALAAFLGADAGAPTGISVLEALVAGLVLLFISAGRIALGLGSLAYARWARALSLASYWICLVYILPYVVLLDLYFLEFLQSLMEHEVGGDGAAPTFLAVGMFLVSFFIVLFPAVMVWLYSGKDVKHTCEFHHPRESWTDRCPFPMLLMSMVFVVFALGTMQWFSTFSFRFPVWGWVLDDAAALAVGLGVTLMCIIIAYGLYKKRRAAWLGAWAALLFLGGSMLSTLFLMDIRDLYGMMGLTDIDPDFRYVDALPPREALLACALFYGCVLCGYLFYIRRFLRAAR